MDFDEAEALHIKAREQIAKWSNVEPPTDFSREQVAHWQQIYRDTKWTEPGAP